ncbi:UPF0575 protein C19orf67 homolog [Anabas testudineus]|uniref:Uncharacterized protein n=1 Tax=Anabas testudineus TaxID=64144 RepID=A0A7N6BL82_ANATE|nr:UPF0575 protein C19orf67 homolog [Anabas testudineus]
MTDVEVQGELQLENSPIGQHGVPLQEDTGGGGGGGGKEPDCRESLQNSTQTEVDDEPLSLLADVALAPRCGDRAACSCLQVREMERCLQSMQVQLQVFMHKADDLHNSLVNGKGDLEREASAATVQSFLYTCQPYFNYLESTARSARPHKTPLPANIYTRMLDFSQQLCDKLEQLVLTYASYSLLCLDEAEPNSVSHFCIGQRQCGPLKLTAFRYCQPVPYLARLDTGLYKRMRWNVERLRDEQQTDEEHGGESEERNTETEYYLLCYEEIPNIHADTDRDSHGTSHCNMMKTWSIGRWVQVDPDPNTEDIYDWIMCEVPQATYHRLLFLGSEEPSSCSATDYLQQLLLSQQTTG